MVLNTPIKVSQILCLPRGILTIGQSLELVKL